MAMRNERRESLAGASRSTKPSSHSCTTAIAVKVLVTDPIRNTVSSLTGSLNSISATPRRAVVLAAGAWGTHLGPQQTRTGHPPGFSF